MAFCWDDTSYDETKYWERERTNHCMQSLTKKIGAKSIKHMEGSGPEYKFNVSEKYVVELDAAHKIKYVLNEDGSSPCQSTLDEIREIKCEIADIKFILDTHDNTAKVLKHTITSLRGITNAAHVQGTLDPKFPDSIVSFSTECIDNCQLVITKIIELTTTLGIKTNELEKKTIELQKRYIEVLALS
jgi:uncharacterized protein YfcZ (UPF0381/DUF406 family)